MRKKEIIHIHNDSPISSDFLDFMSNRFQDEDHKHFVLGHHNKYYKIHQINNYKQVNNLLSFFDFFKSCFNSNSIIIHGFFSPYLLLVFLSNSVLIQKTFWMVWGGDLRSLEKSKEGFIFQRLLNNVIVFIKIHLLRKLRGIVTYVKGDYEDACKKLGVNLDLFECIMYPSNIYKPVKTNTVKNSTSPVNIQIGNSADSTNNHIEILNILVTCKEKNIKVFCPLSYGLEEIRVEVIEKGKELFGNKFVPVTNFMSLQEYNEFQSNIDIAIFNHDKQAAMGNTISLIGMGKKVYLKNGTSQWNLFNELGVKIYDVQSFDLTLNEDTIEFNNVQKIKEYFSEENLAFQLQQIFNQ
jgi:dTDP-N-acetylfucosamine:lipid II N-acetylfucosaminyltransferase